MKDLIDLLTLSYNDALQPAAKEVGKCLRDIFKALRLLTLPAQAFAFAQETIDIFLDKATAGIKEENLIMPPGQIIGKIYQELRFYNSNSIHMTLLANLMSCFINKERLQEAHPAFILLIPQLSEDEINILKLLNQRKYKIHEYSMYDNSKNAFSNRKVISNEFPLLVLNYADNFPMYISHLLSLNLAGCWQDGSQEPEMNDGKQVGTHINSKLELTQFGTLFCKACLDD